LVNQHQPAAAVHSRRVRGMFASYMDDGVLCNIQGMMHWRKWVKGRQGAAAQTSNQWQKSNQSIISQPRAPALCFHEGDGSKAPTKIISRTRHTPKNSARSASYHSRQAGPSSPRFEMSSCRATQQNTPMFRCQNGFTFLNTYTGSYQKCLNSTSGSQRHLGHCGRLGHHHAIDHEFREACARQTASAPARSWQRRWRRRAR
jgi:hypothetical protein